MKQAWIVSPALDLFFVCGGGVFALAFLSHIAAHCGALHQTVFYNNLAVALALLLGETHTTATIVGLAHDGKWSAKHGGRSKTVAWLCLILAFAILLIPALVPLAVRMYLLSVSWHFTRQVYGIVLIYCRKSGYEPDSIDRGLWQAVLQLTMLVWICVQLSNYLAVKEEVFLLQRLPPLAILPPGIVDIMLGAILTCTLLIAARLIFQIFSASACNRIGQSVPPPQALLLLFAVVFMFLPLGPALLFQGPIWLYAPALFHGSQYLCVMWARFSGESDQPERATALTGLYAKCLTLALLFFVCLPFCLSQVFAARGLHYDAAVVAVFVAVQIYHMAMDAVIWRGGKLPQSRSGYCGLKLRVGHRGSTVVHGATAVTVCLNRR